MARLWWKPDGFKCSSILTLCGSLKSLKHGRQAFAYYQGQSWEWWFCEEQCDLKCDDCVWSQCGFLQCNVEGCSWQEKLYEALDSWYEAKIVPAKSLNFCVSVLFMYLLLHFHLVFLTSFFYWSNTSSVITLVCAEISIPRDQEQSNNEDWIVAEEAVLVQHENS